MESENIVVSLRGLSRSYREGEQTRVVIDHLDLDIPRGECVALLGRSGSGKSTLLNLISGIDLPTAGTIRVNGVELTALTERERTLFRRRHVGFVYQFFNLIPTLTVEENLLLPLELNRRDKGTARHTAIALLEEIGLGDRTVAGFFNTMGRSLRCTTKKSGDRRPALRLRIDGQIDHSSVPPASTTGTATINHFLEIAGTRCAGALIVCLP